MLIKKTLIALFITMISLLSECIIVPPVVSSWMIPKEREIYVTADPNKKIDREKLAKRFKQREELKNSFQSH